MGKRTIYYDGTSVWIVHSTILVLLIRLVAFAIIIVLDLEMALTSPFELHPLVNCQDLFTHFHCLTGSCLALDLYAHEHCLLRWLV